jgi:hypothetical protein
MIHDAMKGRMIASAKMAEAISDTVATKRRAGGSRSAE